MTRTRQSLKVSINTAVELIENTNYFVVCYKLVRGLMLRSMDRTDEPSRRDS